MQWFLFVCLLYHPCIPITHLWFQHVDVWFHFVARLHIWQCVFGPFAIANSILNSKIFRFNKRSRVKRHVYYVMTTWQLWPKILLDPQIGRKFLAGGEISYTSSYRVLFTLCVNETSLYNRKLPAGTPGCLRGKRQVAVSWWTLPAIDFDMGIQRQATSNSFVMNPSCHRFRYGDPDSTLNLPQFRFQSGLSLRSLEFNKCD